MADDSFGERTEKATGKRRSEARKKGQVAKSREIPSVLVLLSGFSVLFFLYPYFYRQLREMMVHLLNSMALLPITPANMHALQKEVFWSLFLILAPIFLTVSVIAVLSNYLQVGNLFAWEAVQPNLSKLNPIQGLTRLISKHSAVELVKSICKLLIIGWVAYSTIQKEGAQILTLIDQEAGSILGYISSTACSILFKTIGVMLGLAVLDYVFQRWNFEKSLRMTKREVQEEFKQLEGNPMIRSRIRSIQREMARRRMMAEVPKADVIITNPTHLAVALVYKNAEMEAPKVLAKGAGLIAEKIKEVGRAHRIPFVENKPLAQILYRTVELGGMIPSSLYQMVANILAFVYRMKHKTP